MAGFQIHLQISSNFSHQETSIPGNQTADTATHRQSLWERYFQLLTFQIIKEQTGIGSYPHTIIPLIVSQSAHEIKQIMVFSICQNTRNLSWMLKIHDSQTCPPCTNPKISLGVGCKSRHTVVWQTGIGCRIMDEMFGMRHQTIKTALNRSCIERTIRRRIHGIDSIRGNTARIIRIMTVEFQLQQAWHQFGNTPRLRADPNLSVSGKKRINKVAAQGIDWTCYIPMLNLLSFIIKNIYTAERTH